MEAEAVNCRLVAAIQNANWIPDAGKCMRQFTLLGRSMEVLYSALYGSPHQSTIEDETDVVRSIDFDTRLSLDIVDIVGRFIECLRMGAIYRVIMLWIIDI